MVFEEDYHKAASLLNQQDTDIILCPFCNSEHIRVGLGKYKYRKLFAIILSIISATPVNNIENTYYCLDCKSDL